VTRINVTLKGQDRLEHLISMKYRSLKTDIAKVGNEVTTNMTRTATYLVPVLTGALRDTIEQIPAVIKRNIIEFGFSAGGDGVIYAGFQEYGTSKMRPQPYMWPAEKLHHTSLIIKLKKVGRLDG